MRPKLRVLIFFSLAALALVALAAGLANMTFLPGRPLSGAITRMLPGVGPDFRVRLPGPNFLMTLIALVYWPLLLLSVVMMIVSPQIRRRVLRDALYLSLAYFAIFLLFRNMKGFNLDNLETPLPSPQAQTPFEALGSVVADPPAWLAFAVSLALVTLLLARGWLLWKRLRGGEPAAALVVSQARQALDELAQGADLRNTVIRCYYEMGRILYRRQGLRRHQAMTAREFERLMEQAGLGSAYAQQLTRLFEEVRYGDRAAGEQEERQAVACLEGIVRTYGGQL